MFSFVSTGHDSEGGFQRAMKNLEWELLGLGMAG